MESALGFQTRREILLQMVPRYREASVLQKGALLDEIVTLVNANWSVDLPHIWGELFRNVNRGISLSMKKATI